MKAARIPRNRVRECRTHGSVGGAVGQPSLLPGQSDMRQKLIDAHKQQEAAEQAGAKGSFKVKNGIS